MRKGIQIKALFLVGIFSLILVHQAVPHHHHDSDHHSHDSIAHSHTELDHRHHHEHQDKEEISFNKNLLNRLIEFHSCGTTPTLEHLPNHIIVKKQKSIDLKIVPSIAIISNIELRDFKSNNKLQLYSSPDIAYEAHLVRPELRGPPFLG